MNAQQIGAIPDAASRAQAAQSFLDRAEFASREVRMIRDAAVVAMRVQGLSQRQAASIIGKTSAWVAAIDRKAAAGAGA